MESDFKRVFNYVLVNNVNVVEVKTFTAEPEPPAGKHYTNN